MRPSELFEPDDLLLGFDPVDKWTAIEALVRHLVERGKIDAAMEGPIAEAVLDRERSMSTGMEHGVAIPHAAVEEVETIVGCIGVVQGEEGLAFDSIDGNEARLVVLLVIPKAEKILHIRTLADISRVLSKDNVRKCLLEASEAPGAHAMLVAAEG